MRFPDKITSYKESVFRLIPLILNQISKCDMRPVEIYELIKSCTSPSEYIEALDCLFILKKIEFNQQSGELHYVA